MTCRWKGQKVFGVSLGPAEGRDSWVMQARVFVIYYLVFLELHVKDVSLFWQSRQYRNGVNLLISSEFQPRICDIWRNRVFFITVYGWGLQMAFLFEYIFFLLPRIVRIRHKASRLFQVLRHRVFAETNMPFRWLDCKDIEPQLSMDTFPTWPFAYYYLNNKYCRLYKLRVEGNVTYKKLGPTWKL